MDYKPGWFTKPCRAWFGKNWKPHATWVSTDRKATRTSADGDNLDINTKPMSHWTTTKAKSNG